MRTVGDIIAGSGDTVRTDGLDEFARANVLRSDRAVKISTFVSNGGSLLWPGRTLSAPLRRPHSNPGCLLHVCAVTRRRFPVGASPTRQTLQPEATGAVMDVAKWLEPSV